MSQPKELVLELPLPPLLQLKPVYKLLELNVETSEVVFSINENINDLDEYSW